MTSEIGRLPAQLELTQETLEALETGVLVEAIPEVVEEKREVLFSLAMERNLAGFAVKDAFRGWGPARTREEHPEYDTDRFLRAV